VESFGRPYRADRCIWNRRWEAAIPRFHFHLKHDRECIVDDEGTDLPHCEAAYLQAFDSAQELWSMLLDRREDPTAYVFEVSNGEGCLLFILPLSEVLETVRKGRRLPRTEALDRASALLSRTKDLYESLVQEIEAARRALAQTRGLLNEWHARDRGPL
jgi:hypothetical protein